MAASNTMEGRRRRRAVDANAAHNLALACQRFERASLSGDDRRAEAMRREVVLEMACVAEEFGLVDEAAALREQLPQFDGRHTEGQGA